MRALRHLEDEHRLIEPILGRVLIALSPFDAQMLQELGDFLLGFVDRMHHTKEEQVLFDALRERGKDMVAGPLAVLEKEHALIRSHLVTALSALPDASRSTAALASLRRSLTAYVELSRAHLQKEETVLYPIAERVLLPASDAFLMAQLEDIERKLAKKEDLARWATLAGRTGVHDQAAPSATAPRTDEGAKAPLEARGLVTSSEADRADQRDVVTEVVRRRSGRVLFDDGVHSNVLLHDFGRGLAVQANQYLIVHDGQGMILDPGGPKVYPNLFAEMTQHISPKDLKYIFLSHQDPDIGTSINAWLMDTPAQAVISRLWMRFLPHFGIDKLLEERMTGIPDEGMILDLGGAPLVLLPAHFLHSPGNFQVYDPRTKVLFSGDLGASVDGESGTVEDFDAHARSMLGFHRRYMASEKAMNAWVKMVRTLDVEVIAPQHGPLFQGRDMVQKFIGWCEGLRCGVDLVDRYVVPSPGP